MRIAMTYKSLGSPKFVSYLNDAVFYCGDLGKRGVGDFAWALIAVEHCGARFPDNAANTPETLLKSIAEAELEGGGFALTGTAPDADTTAIVLRALAPHRDACAELVARTLNALSALQQESGAFASLGTETAESTAQAVLALSRARHRARRRRAVCEKRRHLRRGAVRLRHRRRLCAYTRRRDRRARHRAGAFRAARPAKHRSRAAAPLKNRKYAGCIAGCTGERHGTDGVPRGGCRCGRRRSSCVSPRAVYEAISEMNPGRRLSLLRSIT